MGEFINGPNHETEKQRATVDRLEAQGWSVDTTDEDTVYLSKRSKVRGQTLYCQVDRDGDVN